MKTRVLYILLTVFTAGLAINATSVNKTEEEKGVEFFNGTWEEALAKAKKENKLIFVDAYTTWCGPCKWMNKNTFTNKHVAKFFNANFVCVKIDCEKGEGVRLADQWNINAYPTLLAVNYNGKVKKKKIGAQDVYGLMRLGEKWASKTDKWNKQ